MNRLRAALRALLGAPALPAPRQAEFRDDACTCGSEFFTAGGQSVSISSNGVASRVAPVGAVLTCLACGLRWYSTPKGLREPHRDAMPSAWAARDLQREATEKLTDRAVAEPPKPRVPRPHMADIHHQPSRG